MRNKGVPLVVFAILLTNEVADTFAQFCFKKTAMLQGATSMTGLGDAWAFVCSALGQGYLWMGLATVAVVLVSWLVVLSKVDLSVAMPLTSSSYVFVALTSMIFLHEHISLMRWCGILLILVGVLIVSLSSHREEEKAA